MYKLAPKCLCAYIILNKARTEENFYCVNFVTIVTKISIGEGAYMHSK